MTGRSSVGAPATRQFGGERPEAKETWRANEVAEVLPAWWEGPGRLVEEPGGLLAVFRLGHPLRIKKLKGSERPPLPEDFCGAGVLLLDRLEYLVEVW